MRLESPAMLLRKRKWIAGSIGLLVIVIAVALRAFGPYYKGRTVDYWFGQYCDPFYLAYASIKAGNTPGRIDIAEADAAFAELGSKAVPYLASRINRELGTTKGGRLYDSVATHMPPSLLRFFPSARDNAGEASLASTLLEKHFHGSGHGLVPLLEPSLNSTNAYQRAVALHALGGIRQDKELAVSVLVKGLEDRERLVRVAAARSLGRIAPDGAWVHLVGADAEAHLRSLSLLHSNENNASLREAIYKALPKGKSVQNEEAGSN